MSSVGICHRKRRSKGTVLIVAMWIVLALAGLVLVFARAMRIELTAAANHVAGLQSENVARGALQFVYQFRLPGGPGNNDANAVDGDLTTWAANFGDCPRITADTGGSGNGKVLNGLILAGAAGLILIVLGLRGLRRRRERRG